MLQRPQIFTPRPLGAGFPPYESWRGGFSGSRCVAVPSAPRQAKASRARVRGRAHPPVDVSVNVRLPSRACERSGGAASPRQHYADVVFTSPRSNPIQRPASRARPAKRGAANRPLRHARNSLPCEALALTAREVIVAPGNQSTEEHEHAQIPRPGRLRRPPRRPNPARYGSRPDMIRLKKTASKNEVGRRHSDRLIIANTE